MQQAIAPTPQPPVDHLDPRQFIIIKGAKVHNLKNIDVAIPRNKLVVLTGLSGSGKSSLAFDTLFAEGQRMYVESLSSYARQFLGRMEKPDVEYIRGVSPAIAIEQKVTSRNPRSTVGTSTEIYDYFKLLFARAGITYSPISGGVVKKDTVTDVVNFLYSFDDGQRIMIMAPLRVHEERTLSYELKILLQKGYTRIVTDGAVKQIEELLEDEKGTDRDLRHTTLEILIDRGTVQHDADGNPDEEGQYRYSDSVQTAFSEGDGTCRVNMVGQDGGPEESRTFSDKFELDGIAFEEPTVNLFTFNNPYGACRRCDGFGKVLGIDPDLVIPDKNLSVFEGAIAPWRSEKMSEEFLKPLLKNGIRFDFPIHRPFKDLTPAEQETLWTGNQYFQGINAFFDFVESQTFKVQYRVLQSRYRGRTTCPDCRGTRLRKDAQYVTIDGRNIADIVLLPISEALKFFENLSLGEHDAKVAERLVTEITNRLGYLNRVGLGYLTLNRLSNTLSGGESQRISLATSLGSALVGSMYVLDEPSIGLHPKDAEQLIGVLRSLQQLGNTVVVVEHEEKMMEAADQIIDIGPEAGSGGGNLMFQGTMAELLQD
ncbi:MAG: excinuclease ABC subunit A, partial [Bacteroidetes bacterium]|nr:excinuclease ABC subunit A [Fibrella sp.]